MVEERGVIIYSPSMRSFLSPEPQAFITNAFARPFDNVVATARTCYSAKGIITDADVAGPQDADETLRAEKAAARDHLAQDLYRAGHHTTLQHAHFQFALSNVSRHFIWSFLHSHPFYNSEQVSQRYVTVKPGFYTVPPLEEPALQIYHDTVAAQNEAYSVLTEALVPRAMREYFARFPARGKRPEAWRKEIRKKAQETARYVLPVATFAYLYHTVSGLTLLRYYRTCGEFDTPLEQKIVLTMGSRLPRHPRGADPARADGRVPDPPGDASGQRGALALPRRVRRRSRRRQLAAHRLAVAQPADARPECARDLRHQPLRHG